MVARGEIGLLIVQIGYNQTSYVSDTGLNVAIWAILLNTIIGPIIVGLLIKFKGESLGRGPWGTQSPSEEERARYQPRFAPVHICGPLANRTFAYEFTLLKIRMISHGSSEVPYGNRTGICLGCHSRDLASKSVLFTLGGIAEMFSLAHIAYGF